MDFLQLSEEKREEILLKPRFALNLPQRLANKIQKNTLSDPILRQFIPLKEETKEALGFVKDPVQDCSKKQTSKLLHKYHGRALVLASSACAMHCRYCFRQNFPYETEEKGFEKEIEYIRNTPNLSEIILSGGDPLSLGDAALSNLFSELDTIDHVQRIRFHSRFPVGIPERIDDSFLNILKNSKKQIIFVVHVNHPLEIDADVVAALKKIQALGVPVLNQSVLLKGVNDSETTLLELSETLMNAGVIPYYLHALDPVEGTNHFFIPETQAKGFLKAMQTQTSGFGVPRLAREEPGKPSKTFITY